MYRRCIKRLLDIILALIGLILLSPVFLILMLLVRKKLGSPVFFHQERPGKDGKIFGLMKFRSMTDARDEEGNGLLSIGLWQETEGKTPDRCGYLPGYRYDSR